MDYRIEKVLASIENDVSKTLTVKNLAESVNLSVSHFQHLFKREVGKSVSQYVRDLRLEKARQLLEESHLRVKEIQVKVGAISKTHFLRDFKKDFGVTHSQYRKNYHEQQNLYINSRIG